MSSPHKEKEKHYCPGVGALYCGKEKCFETPDVPHWDDRMVHFEQFCHGHGKRGSSACLPEKEKREDAGKEGGEWEKRLMKLSPDALGDDFDGRTLLLLGDISLFSKIAKDFIGSELSRTRKEAEADGAEKVAQAVRTIYCGKAISAPMYDYHVQAADNELAKIKAAAKEDGVEIGV